MGKRKTREQFIRDAIHVHSTKYDYTNVEYKNNKTPVNIICPKHGTFKQTPDNHLRGQGCPKCVRPDIDDFISRAKERHGDFYDYSKIDYVDTHTKVVIICPIHGEFMQDPTKHWEGQGCPKCAREKAYHSTAEFIAAAKKIHADNQYDYSKVDYQRSNEKVMIICPKHGEFTQTPSSHLSGNGCPSCAGLIRTTERFIEKANAVHNGKYDYSKSYYENSSTLVTIICPKHGEFEQTPSSHLQGRGCPLCGREKASCATRSDRDTFISQAIKVHGDIYRYEDVTYVNATTKVSIECPKHGKFYQAPMQHLLGQGCPKCAHERISEMKSYDDETFRKKANQVHRDRYDYEDVHYENSMQNIPIRCPEHGIFWQRAGHHLAGAGCPKCAPVLQHETKKANGTCNSSAPEETLYEKLVETFGSDDVERQYFDSERYPFYCDFYIKSRDLFIELNASWTHGGHWFDETCKDDCVTLQKWQEKSINSSFYESAINVWTVRDPLKRATAAKNGLKYLVFWDNDLSDAIIWLSRFSKSSKDM